MSKTKSKQMQKSEISKCSSKYSQSTHEKNYNESILTSASSKPVAQNTKTKPGLYIVATPIGNAQDITLRALDTLRSADVIVCEDTRVTSRLLAIHNISRPLMPYHEHNSKYTGPKIISRLKRGEIIALVSDAGTPLISDPGFRLVQACSNEAIFVTHIPGASSILTSLVLAGLPTDQFLFAGFPPNKTGKRSSFFERLKFVPATLVFLENPKRLAKSLIDMARVFGSRDAALARELTKKFEEVRRGSLHKLSNHYKKADAPKGEIIILISPPSPCKTLTSHEEIDRLLEKALKFSSLKDAVSSVVSATGAPKKEVYTRAIEMSEQIK